MFRTLHATRISTRNLFAVRRRCRRHRRRRHRIARSVASCQYRPAGRPPAHPAVICNTIRFAAAVLTCLGCCVVEMWMWWGVIPARGERTGLALACCCCCVSAPASNAFFCSFALLPALRAEWTQLDRRTVTQLDCWTVGANSSLGIFNLTMRAIYVGISWRAF